MEGLTEHGRLVSSEATVSRDISVWYTDLCTLCIYSPAELGWYAAVSETDMPG